MSSVVHNAASVKAMDSHNHVLKACTEISNTHLHELSSLTHLYRVLKTVFLESYQFCGSTKMRMSQLDGLQAPISYQYIWHTSS